jgi:PAS domain S-box-containing protein
LEEYGVFKARRLPSGEEIGPDDWALAHTVRDGVTTIDEELEIDAFDGQKKVILNSTAPVIGDDGKVMGAIVVNQDITERVRAEQALRESEDKYRTLSENMQDYIMRYDRQFRHVYANTAAIAVTGRTPEEYIGKTHREMGFPDDLCTLWEQGIQEVFDTGKPHREVFTWRGVEGTVVLDWRVFPEFANDGSVQTALAVSRDITELKRAEAQQAQQFALASALATLYAPLVSPEATLQEIGCTVLEQSKRLTSSEHGFVSTIDPVTGNVLSHTLSDMMGPLCEVYSPAQPVTFARGPDGRYPALWGAALNTRRGFYTNSPADYPGAKGTPQGHVPLRRFLSAPVMLGEELVGQIALANAPRDYTEDDVNAIEQVAGYYALAIQRLRAAEALRAERDRARAYLDVAGVMILALDLEGHIVLINRKGCELLGYAENELLGRSWFETCLPPASRGEVQRLAAQIVAGEEAPVEYHENVVVTHSGDERLIAWHNVALKDHAGRVIGTLSSGEDITAQRRAEALIHESEERFRALVESSSDHIFILDAEGCYLFSNDRTQQLSCACGESLGCGRDLVGRRVDEVYPDAVAQTYRQMIGRVLEQDQPVQFEHSLPNGAGENYHVDTLYPIHRDGHPWAVGGICHDVTALRQMEGRLRHGERLQAIGTLAGGVAHEFNNLLTVINGYADIIMRAQGAAGGLYAEAAEIAKAGSRAAGLTKQLLAFGRRQTLQVRSIDLNDLLNNMLKMLTPMLPETIAVKLVLAPELGIVRGEASQLEQVVLNLAANARDAMPAGGTLTLRTANVELTAPLNKGSVQLAPGRYVALAVEDTGHGMPPEVLKHLFEPFFTTKEVGQGTGLGLASAYGIIKQLEGEIEVQSQVGRGTTFTIYLPRIAERAAPEVARQSEAVAQGTQTILVVEDDPAVRRLAARLLGTFGYAVMQAADPLTAIEIVRSASPAIDLVLTDVVMPDLSGPQLAVKLRALRPDLPVLFTSGYADEFLNTHGYAGSVGSLVRKPFEAADLAEKVRKALRH